MEDSEQVTLERLFEPYRVIKMALNPRNCSCNRAARTLATIKLYIQQQWDPGMRSLAFEAEEETATSVQYDLHNLERALG